MSPMELEAEQERDPAFYTHDMRCAILDMFDKFGREKTLNSLNTILATMKFEVIDYGRAS